MAKILALPGCCWLDQNSKWDVEVVLKAVKPYMMVPASLLPGEPLWDPSGPCDTREPESKLSLQLYTPWPESQVAATSQPIAFCLGDVSDHVYGVTTATIGRLQRTKHTTPTLQLKLETPAQQFCPLA